MSTELDVRPSDPALDNEEPIESHIVRKDDQMRAYIEGVPVEALCGKVWVPSRDPQRYPVCERCKEIMGRLKGAGSN